MTGVVTRRFDVDVRGTGWVFAAKFRPGGLAALAGGPAREWRDRTIRALDVLAAAVVEPLACARPPRARRGVPGRLRVRALDLVPASPIRRTSRCSTSWPTCSATGACSPSPRSRSGTGSALGSSSGCSRSYVGATPKWVLARYRMHDAVTRLDEGYDGSLADLAAEHGWYDQAHFTRDFRRLVGQSPGSYARGRDPACERTGRSHVVGWLCWIRS